MPHKTTVFFNRNYLDYGAQDKALRQRGRPGPDIYGGTHHKAYFSTIDSKYWKNTTLTFKRVHARHMWNYYYWEVGYKPLPRGYNQMYNKYGK